MNRAESTFEECQAVLRERDRDLYLCSLLAPERSRMAVTGLYAFTGEIVRARRTVSEAAIGQMRLKWWYDALDGIFAGAPARHPVAETLAEAARAGIQKVSMAQMIEAHADDMVAPVAFDTAAQEARAGALWAPLFRAVAAVTGQGESGAEAAAVLWGLTQALRSEPVPPDRVAALHGAAMAALPRARGHLPAVLAGIYLKRIQRAGFDLGHPSVRRADPGALALPKLWWAARRS
jgi:hypothetical protein